MFAIKLCFTLLLLILFISDCATYDCSGTDDLTNQEMILLKKLFCPNYDKSERPVKNHNTAVNVTMSMHVQNYDVSEGKSTLYLYVWMSSTWKDEFLTWDRTENSVEKIVIDSDEIWRPTFVAFHNVKSGNGATACGSHPCEVKPSGAVLCVAPCQYEALCISDTASWPFDSLRCTMFLGSWLQDVNQINISRSSNVSTSEIEVQHAEWQIKAVEKLHIFLPDNTSYPSLEYIFTMQRHIAIYTAVLTPGFLMIIISLAVLWMNCRSAERLYILCATCMGHFTYMEYLYWRLPYHGEQVPKMLLFFRDSLIINVLMVAFTVLLRYTIPDTDSEKEHLVDKLASRVASTTLGRVILQSDDSVEVKEPATTDEENVDTDNSNKLRSDNFEGDTVNLVTDAADDGAPVTRPASTGHQRGSLVIALLDRIMFICFLVCYTLMIFSLLPTESK